jgi:ribosomal protein S6
MKYYELTYLISPDLSEREALDFQEKIISLIQEGGGALGEVKEPVKKKMAYLATLNFHLEPEKLESLEKKLKAEGQILRHMILTKPKQVKETHLLGKKPAAQKPAKKTPKPEAKVELKEIEKKLEEILDEQ